MPPVAPRGQPHREVDLVDDALDPGVQPRGLRARLAVAVAVPVRPLRAGVRGGDGDDGHVELLRHGLRGVDDAAAAEGDEPVGVARDLERRAHALQVRVRLGAVEAALHAGRVDVREDLVGDEQRTLDPQPPQDAGQLLQTPFHDHAAIMPDGRGRLSTRCPPTTSPSATPGPRSATPCSSSRAPRRPDTPLAQARETFANPHVQLLLVVEEDGRFAGTLTRDTIPAEGDGPIGDHVDAEAARIDPGAPVAQAVEMLDGTGTNRLPVVDDDGVLLGLVCWDRSGQRFCVDAGRVS